MTDHSTRERVRTRAAGRCEYCLIHQDDDQLAFHVEHVISRKHGGSDADGNLAFSCQQCNLHKGTNLSGIDPVSDALTRLFHPREDLWADHFRYWGARIEGLTPVGRTTVRVLCFNDPDRVLLRELLGYSDNFGAD